MKPRANSPRTTETTLADLGAALRKVEVLRQRAAVDASRAWKREDDAEQRLHFTHDFFHELLAVRYGLKKAPWVGNGNSPINYIIAALAEVLGYGGEAMPTMGDVQTWLDADKPTPARSRAPYDNGPSPHEQRKAEAERLQPPMRIGALPSNNDHEHDGA